MNRNLFIKYFVCMLFAAVLAGCGGNEGVVTDVEMPDSTQDAADAAPEHAEEAGEDAKHDVDAASEADAQSSDADAGLEADSATEADAQEEPDAEIEAGEDADAAQEADAPVEPDADAGDEPDVQVEAGQDADAAGDAPVGQDADAAQEAEAAIDAQPEADAPVGQDADAAQEAEAAIDAQPEADAPVGQDADAAPEATPDANDAAVTPDVQVYDAPAPPAEICDNNIDDDTDGLKDCSDTDCASFLKCKPEVCNGLDDNGDSLPDNGPGMECVGVEGNGVPCDFSCGAILLPGHRTCDLATCKWSVCRKIIDSEADCTDGLDNDCDGLKDCADTDCLADTICKPESCNNQVDDNANGLADCADPACVNSPNCICTPPQVGWDCLYAGEYSCNPAIRCDCWFKWNNASDSSKYLCTLQETCNGQDDNGNGLKDDGFSCVQYETSSCVTSCGSTGTQYCKSDCTKAACQAPVEVCNNNKDDDCDGKADCQDPECAAEPNCKVPETCNGLDDDGDGAKDNGPGMECVGTVNNTRSCTTSCGSEGRQTCSVSTCKWGACEKPATETKCSDTKDDDCDGYTDCQDPDCWGTLACPHNFGTCQPFTPTNVPQQCTYTQEAFIADLPLVVSACANGENDQWVLASDYSSLKLFHKTNVWAEVALPVTGNIGSGDVSCAGSGQVYIVYNEYLTQNGILAKWNGSAVQVLAKSDLVNRLVTTVHAFSATDVRFFAVDSVGYLDAWVYKWNGSSLSKVPLPSFAPLGAIGKDMWGTSPQDIYLAGAVRELQWSAEQAMLLHYDGTSWARVAVPSDFHSINYIHGTSSCDIMASSNKQDVYATLQRNGSVWESRLYPELKYMGNVVKTSPFKYLIPGAVINGMDPFTVGVVGTDVGNFTTSWEIEPSLDQAQFTWKIPGTSKHMVLGQGINMQIITADCQ